MPTPETEAQAVNDYILGITKAIWEDRKISSLTRYYGQDLIVRSPASIVKGNTGIIAATMATLAEFPDRELFGEDVIWTGSAEKFLSSHRLICTATHLAPGVYGPPSGRRVSYRIIADCFCFGDAVQDEWLVRDQSAIVDQLGFDVEDWTRDLIRREGGPEKCVQPFVPANDLPGPYDSAGNDNPWGDQLADALKRIMASEFSVIPKAWNRAVETHYPRATSGFGTDTADRFWLGLRACFPSATFTVHHQVGLEIPGLPPRASVRWSLDGLHSGHGQFGNPTQSPVHVMGMTHVEFGPNGIRREWTLIDETSVIKQILLHSGRV